MNDIKLLPLPDWMDDFFIPDGSFGCIGWDGEDVSLSDRMESYARANIERYESDKDIVIAQLVEALSWYVETDEVNEGMEGNEFWVDGRNRARDLLNSLASS